jgi:hypothetical protein
MDEGDTRLERRRLGDQRVVMGFLRRSRGEEREAGGPRCHHIGMVAKDRKRLRRERAGGNVKHRRRQLARDLVHTLIPGGKDRRELFLPWKPVAIIPRDPVNALLDPLARADMGQTRENIGWRAVQSLIRHLHRDQVVDLRLLLAAKPQYCVLGGGIGITVRDFGGSSPVARAISSALCSPAEC